MSPDFCFPLYTPLEREAITLIVIDKVAQRTNTTCEALLSTSRMKDVAYARHVCMWLLVTHFAFSTSDAAVALNRIDHGSAIHSRDTVNALIGLRAEFGLWIDALVQEVRAVWEAKHPSHKRIIAPEADTLATMITRITDPSRLMRLRDLINLMIPS